MTIEDDDDQAASPSRQRKIIHIGGQLRSAQIRRPIGRAIGDSQAAVPGPDLRAPHFEVYMAGAQQIRKLFAEHTPSLNRRRLTKPTWRSRKICSAFR